MQSFAIASIMVAAATLTTAAPARRADTKFYNCANNGFIGQCSVDPCALPWCPDAPQEAPKPAPQYYVCAANGFKGLCSVDPCALPWCPDAPKPVETKPAPQYYVCANNGFKGLCSVDPCALPWCPDVPKPVDTEEKTPEPVPVPAPTTKKEHYVCASNGFNGDCSVNACNVAWCPDYEYRTYTPVVKTTKRSDPTVCAPGTGYFQSCSNGFRGCCKSDACGSKTQWCPDYKPWTFEPVTSTVKTETVPEAPKTETPKVETVAADYCAPGTGFYQVCGNGFKGCCKYDACTLGYCPSN